ncbi:MAG: hypothetical protein ABSC19_06050, partial [Syntrophorhabdales bacterium]
GTGLPSGYLTNIPSFNFNLNDSMTSGTGSQMLNLAMQQIQAQQAASGGFGSGNQATALANYIGGTYEPTLYNQAYQTYQTNQIDPRELIYGMLTGNTGGSGQSTANTLANLYTGTSSEALGSANALTSMLTGLGTGATGGMGNMYLNYLGNQNLVNALGQNSGMSNLYSSPVNASSALWL